MLGIRLLSLHNVAFLIDVASRSRAAIREGRFAQFLAGSLAQLAAAQA